MKLLKRLGLIAVVLAVATGVGFWARPVSYFNELTYMRECFSGVESRSITVSGYRMHYNALGPANGPVIVLVHGLGGRAEDWNHLAPYLAKAGFRVYMPDLPGYGRSQQPADFSYSIADKANVVVGFLDALGLKQVNLGGLSMGGWIAQWVASEHPERVRKLILIDSAGIYEKPAFDLRLFTPANPAELDQLEALLMPHPQKIPGFVAEDILRRSKKNAWVIHKALDSAITGRYTTDTLLPGLKMPVLIGWGAEDHITPLSQGEKIHQLVPQSEMEVIPACGHLAVIQCTAQIEPEVVEFVR